MAGRKEKAAKAVAAARKAAALGFAVQLAKDGMRHRGWSSLDLSDASGVPWGDLVGFLHGKPEDAQLRDVNAVMNVFGMRLLPPATRRPKRP